MAYANSKLRRLLQAAKRMRDAIDGNRGGATMFAHNHRRLMQEFPGMPTWFYYLSYAIDAGLVATTVIGAAFLSVALCGILGL